MYIYPVFVSKYDHNRRTLLKNKKDDTCGEKFKYPISYIRILNRLILKTALIQIFQF